MREREKDIIRDLESADAEFGASFLDTPGVGHTFLFYVNGHDHASAGLLSRTNANRFAMSIRLSYLHVYR